MNPNNYCVIMAGGIGSRFWPMSRTQKPKQFLDILGTGQTLLQQTFARFAQICPQENIFIVSNLQYKTIIEEQLPTIPRNNILLEPMRRNTAPCIAYANAKIKLQNPDANIVVAPSDHLILNQVKFLEDITLGLEFVNQNPTILTLGISPSRPETGYEYIQIDANSDDTNGIRKVKTFTEKPNIELANKFIKSGEFFWNSGIFLWNLRTIHSAFAQHMPQVLALFENNTSAYNTPNEAKFIAQTYAACPSISIDYGVMEHATNAYVLCTEFGWSDLGTWGSLYDNSERAENKNVLQGEKILSYDTNNTIIHTSNNKLAIIQGLDNYIVVETDDILLVCKRDDEQRIKEFVHDVKLKFGPDFE